MNFTPPLITGQLIKRYKRFLADIRLEDGTIITAHCPNTGAMHGCSTPGSPAALSISDNPKRKYCHTLEMVQENGTWVGVNTARTNSIVATAINKKAIAQWQDIEEVNQEVSISAKTRLDLRLLHLDGSTTMVEIKSCSLARENVAMFPDAVTKRGTKHLRELTAIAKRGEKSAIFYLVQRMDAESFRPAAEIDPEYATAFSLALAAGVNVLVYQAKISPTGIEIARELPLVAKEEFIVNLTC